MMSSKGIRGIQQPPRSPLRTGSITIYIVWQMATVALLKASIVNIESQPPKLLPHGTESQNLSRKSIQ